MDTTVILFKRSLIDICMSFPVSSVMILLVFLSLLMLSFFFIKDEIASVKLKQIERSAPCVIHSCMVTVKFDY